jgi:hypothetical protein
MASDRTTQQRLSKLLWLGVVALPSWSDHRPEGAIRTQAGAALWVVIIIAAIPWRHVVTQYVLTSREPWRRSRRTTPRYVS